MQTKKQWVSPHLQMTQFAANEYVAACWGIACNYSAANAYEQSIGNYDHGNISHASDHCGSSSNQYLVDDDGDGYIDRMIETGTDGLGNLACTVYSDSSYQTPLSLNEVSSGQTIYWTTSSGSRTWHHQGSVNITGSGVNHS